MMHGWSGRRAIRRFVVVLFLAACLLPSSGCVGMAAYLLHAWKGNKVPADFDGLKGKRVAVVCVADPTADGDADAAVYLLAAAVTERLRRHVPEIDLVDQAKVAQWMDQTGWNELDYRQVGEGVGADLVLAIDVGDFVLQDGATLFKGRARTTISVLDMTRGGERVYYDTPPQIVYPVTGGVPTTETTPIDFRKKFVEVIAHHLAKRFYAYDLKLDFAQDTTFMGPQ